MKQKSKYDSSILNDYSPKAILKSPWSENDTLDPDEIASVLSS